MQPSQVPGWAAEVGALTPACVFLSAQEHQVVLDLLNHSKQVMFDTERKVLMFGNIATE